MARAARNVEMFGVGAPSRASGIRTAESPESRLGLGTFGLPVSNFFIEIAQDYAYRRQWVSRAAAAGLSGRINVTFWDNESGIIDEDVAVNYSETNVVGRSEQYKQYTGTGNREVSLNLQFRAQGAPNGAAYNDSLENWLIREVQNPVRWIESLKYPLIESDLNGGVAHAPPPLTLYVGKLLVMRCILTASKTTWLNPIDPDSLLPYGADVACTFTSVANRPDTYAYSGPQRFGRTSPELLDHNYTGPRNQDIA